MSSRYDVFWYQLIVGTGARKNLVRRSKNWLWDVMSGCTESLQLACQKAATWTRVGTILLAMQQCTTIAVAGAARQSSMQPSFSNDVAAHSWLTLIGNMWICVWKALEKSFLHRRPENYKTEHSNSCALLNSFKSKNKQDEWRVWFQIGMRWDEWIKNQYPHSAPQSMPLLLLSSPVQFVHISYHFVSCML